MGKIDKEKLLNELKNHFPNYKTIAELEFAKSAIELVENFPEEPEIDFDALWKGFKNYCDNSGCIGCIYLKHDNKYQCFKEFLKSKNLTAPQVDMDALRNEIYSKIVKSLQKTKSCPECGCKEYLHENDLGNGYRVCKNCKQEWWTDVDYSNKKYEIPVKRTWTLKKEYGEFVVSMGMDIPLCEGDNLPDKLKKYYDLKEEPDYSKLNGCLCEFKVNNKRIFKIVHKYSEGCFRCISDEEGINHDLYFSDNFVRVVELAKECAV